MGTEWVLLAVPSQDYDELKHMVDFRQEQRGEAVAPSIEELRSTELAVAAVERNALDAHVPWPKEALERLAQESTATTERFAKAMDHCAQHPEHWVSTEEVADVIGVSVSEWRAACRKLRPHLNKHYPEVPRHDSGSHAGEPEWPLVDLAGRSRRVRDQLYVTITTEQAERWKSVRAAQ